MESNHYSGRRPKKPATVADALREIIKVADQWNRRYEQSWYEWDEIPTTDLGFRPPGDLDAIPDLCDEAIEAVTRLLSSAKEAKTDLEDVKAQAEKRLRQRQRKK